jgi:hypothetical protein
MASEGKLMRLAFFFFSLRRLAVSLWISDRSPPRLLRSMATPMLPLGLFPDRKEGDGQRLPVVDRPPPSFAGREEANGVDSEVEGR